MASIPKFNTLEEAAAFWDTHDFEDYVDDTKPVSIHVNLARSKKTLTIPVELRVFQQIEALAAKRGMPIDKLISTWLNERVAAETR